MKANVIVTMKKGVLEPQGRAVARSLTNLGYEGIKEVRVGKIMEIKLDDIPKGKAEKLLDEICERLLANPVIEDYRIEIVDQK